MLSTVTIAQLTDVHLGPIRGFTPRHWGLKRATGVINWHRSRKHALAEGALARIVADMKAAAPDHVVVTGDLVNVGLPAEIEAASEWLSTLGPPERVSVVPGNHDIYARKGSDYALSAWAPHMRSCEAGGAIARFDDPVFPFVRYVGGVAVVGVNSAVPTPVFVASGRVGARQRARLKQTLERLRGESLFRMVLIHHPPLPELASAARGLRDARPVSRLIREVGAELIVHGHNHTNTLVHATGPLGPVPIVGCATASHAGRRHNEPLARYNLYRITPSSGPAGPTIEVIGRGLASPEGPIVELERRELIPVVAAAA